MRIGLMAALRRSDDGRPRAALSLAGRPVLAWQAALLEALGVERVLCLAEGPSPELLAVQHDLESRGIGFHALQSFAALPALVRAEDDLIIVADGLIPDSAAVHAVLGDAGSWRRAVAALPSDHPLAAAHADDFERIDATRRWAGVLAMRGASVQQLADFPPDSDAISLLLRLALQAGTPCRDLSAADMADGRWLLAADPARLREAERGMIARAASPPDWRAPLAGLAALVVRALAPKGLAQGITLAGGVALVVLLAGVMTSAFGPAAAGLALAGLGAFAGQIAAYQSALVAGLQRRGAGRGPSGPLALAVDALAAVCLWFALAPWPVWQPLAVLGPIVIGLARLVARGEGSALAVIAGDRAALLFALALAAAFGLLTEALGCLALGLLAALLLRKPPM
ncbi:hypothetical protein [Erythrobacter donghaensis]|uniref:hypothetical protein n=1 Tax=Erythrobacter donghaensis TaxID=267135 RepID=UPI000A36982D|nr:hypothetical protein [Erythrobacter donghaensis]